MNNQPVATLATLTPRRPVAPAIRLVLTMLCFLTTLALNAGAGIITTIAGGGGSFTITNGMPATNALLNGVQGLATDLTGNLYLAHFSRAAVRRVNPTNGLLFTVAGTGNFGYAGDNGPAVEADLATPQSLAVDLTGNLYICDPSGGSQGVGSIRKADVHTGIITTLLEDPEVGYLGGIAVDVHGNLYIADLVYEVVRKWDATNGFLHTIAGSWLSNGHTGDGGPATNAHLSFPQRVAVDALDNVFILEQGPPTYVRRIDGVTGIITTIAGGGTGDGASGLATNASFYINTNGFTAAAQDLAVDNFGSLYIGGWSQVWQVDLASGNISIVAGLGGTSVGFSGDGGPATNALLSYVLGLAVSSTGDIYIADGGNDRVRKVTSDRPSFAINWFKVAGGGGVGSNATYKLMGTVGQADAGGPHTNSQFSLVGGFWALPVAVQATGAPLLQITSAAPGFATLSWTPSRPGFVLQETLTLSSSNWVNSVSGATNPITVSATLPAKFYRLSKP